MDNVDKKWVFNQADAERFKKYYGYNPDEIIPMGGPIPVCETDYKSVVTGSHSKLVVYLMVVDYMFTKLNSRAVEILYIVISIYMLITYRIEEIKEKYKLIIKRNKEK